MSQTFSYSNNLNTLFGGLEAYIFIHLIPANNPTTSSATYTQNSVVRAYNDVVNVQIQMGHETPSKRILRCGPTLFLVHLATTFRKSRKIIFMPYVSVRNDTKWKHLATSVLSYLSVFALMLGVAPFLSVKAFYPVFLTYPAASSPSFS